MGGTLFCRFDVVKRYLTGAKIPKYFSKMAGRRSTFAGGEKEADSRSRLVTDAAGVIGKPSERRHNSCLELVRGAIPCLLETAHKGQLGRIGVIGGCQE